MGTDIHLVMEWLDGEVWRPFNAEPKPDGAYDDWGKYTPHPSPMEQIARELGISEETEVHFWNFPRDYNSFGQLAGVRSHEDPKWNCLGLPSSCSEQVWGIFHMTIGEPHSWDLNQVNEAWVKRLAPRLTPVEKFGRKWIRNTDYHSPGHLYVKEMEHTPDLTCMLQELIDYVKQLAKTRNIPFDKIRMTYAFDS